jgi:nucleoside diphosphate kinase
VERTFVMLKPDAVQRGLVGEIVNRFERRGLKIVAMKMVHVTAEFAHKHYAAHVGKPFFEGLIKYITSGPVVAMVLEGTNGIEVARATMGATNPRESGTRDYPGGLQPGDGAQPCSRLRRPGHCGVARWACGSSPQNWWITAETWTTGFSNVNGKGAAWTPRGALIVNRPVRSFVNYCIFSTTGAAFQSSSSR